MLGASERRLARLFYSFFIERFEVECETVRESMIPRWEKSKVWTDFMLGSERGLLVRAAKDWSGRTFNAKCETRNEWHKFDLMLVDCTAGSEWWMTVPLVTFEHENGEGIHDEVWKLACWTSRLKVLITYHDKQSKADEKREKAARIIKNIHPGGDPAEWLLLSAPRTWGQKLQWQAHEWNGEAWSAIAP